MPGWEGKSIKNESKITSKKRCKKPSRLGRVLGRLRAVKGAATYSDPMRRERARPGATWRDENPLLAAARAAALRAKIPVKKETVLDVLTRLGPEARRIFDPIRVPTWLHFGFKNPPKSRLGGLLGRLESCVGRLGGVLEATWVPLGASWAVLAASWSVLNGLRAS